jgi:transaldolase
MPKKLDAAEAKKIPDSDCPKIVLNEKQFRYALMEDAMATMKLSEGIRAFCKDTVALENKIAAMF